MTDSHDTAREYFPAAYFPPRADDLDLDFTVVHTPAAPAEEVLDAPKPAPEPAAPAEPSVTETPPAEEEAAKATHPTKATRAPRPRKAPSRKTTEVPETIVPPQEVPTQQAPAPKVAPKSETPATADEDDLDESIF